MEDMRVHDSFPGPQNPDGSSYKVAGDVTKMPGVQGYRWQDETGDNREQPAGMQGSSDSGYKSSISKAVKDKKVIPIR